MTTGRSLNRTSLQVISDILHAFTQNLSRSSVLGDVESHRCCRGKPLEALQHRAPSVPIPGFSRFPPSKAATEQLEGPDVAEGGLLRQDNVRVAWPTGAPPFSRPVEMEVMGQIWCGYFQLELLGGVYSLVLDFVGGPLKEQRGVHLYFRVGQSPGWKICSQK